MSRKYHYYRITFKSILFFLEAIINSLILVPLTFVAGANLRGD